ARRRRAATPARPHPSFGGRRRHGGVNAEWAVRRGGKGQGRPARGGRPMDVGMLILRLVVGALFIGHGTQKLFGWFQGHGLEGTAGFMESLGYRPGKRYAALGGLAEAGGGALLVLGLLTPLAAALIVGMMLNAIL